jgi:hypothetical protein
VFLVWIGWTADEDGDGVVQEDELLLDDEMVGVGRPVLLREIEILPTPDVDLAGISETTDSTGLAERGGLSVSQISQTFTEDVLLGLLPEFRDAEKPETLKPGITFFWELQENRPAGFQLGCQDSADLRSRRRRFHVSGVPARRARSFEWTVNLTRAHGERGREGEVEVVT